MNHEQEQNKRINELHRDMERVRQELHGLKADMEPDGHISDIGNLSEDIDSLERKVDKIYERLSHQINQLAGRQEVMLQMLTRIYRRDGRRES